MKCRVCGRVLALGRRCLCGAAVLFSIALGESPEVHHVELPPIVEVVAPSSARSVAGGLTVNAETGRYILTGFAVSTDSKSR